ncbi:glutamyl-tRNA reductase [Tepidibacter formicigenes]|jgi:glutamyl-tRNA reductase|uniref:Glutamyl-tRNA reductase n=1 Tax=Tepidibacter formicigenes DSM 15518 TaxID=1123349 RepID=A0A1M6RHA4_9FIRM|nr:glutamyl-tRNA reductase [Tepidibacter formicigenes]SHK31758.1 glutamyl-tRNA reductase [Tepidibacter formicigenes DSM 15518]
MRVAVIGVNHNTAPIKIREKVSFTESKKIEGANFLLDHGIKEVIILSTCNRSEIYIVAKDIEEKIKVVKDFYEYFFDEKEIKKYLFIKKHEEAINHIYTVSSGLDSIVLGEDQILGQAKEALLFSMELGLSGKILNKLFREAITTAKNIKNKTKISENPLSISYIGIKFLKEKLCSLKNKKALVIGVGKMSKLALKHLLEEDLNEIYMTNRSHKKVLDLSNEFPRVKPIEYEKRYEVMKNVDVVVTATASPHTIIKKEDMPKVNKNLYIMDIALPRDVEEGVNNLENVYVYDIDNLKKISNENEKKRIELSKIARDIIDESIEEFLEWMKSIKVDPTIKSLNEKCSEIEKDTLEYIYRKLDLDSRERKIIEKMLGSALKRLIREPIIKLKETKDEGKVQEYMNMIEELFGF